MKYRLYIQLFGDLELEGDGEGAGEVFGASGIGSRLNGGALNRSDAQWMVTKGFQEKPSGRSMVKLSAGPSLICRDGR